MSRREDFARLVDGDVTVEDTPVSGLADIATALRVMGGSMARPPASPQFRSDLRQRLVAVATVQAVEPAIAGHAPAGTPSRVAGRRTPRAGHRAVPRGRRAIAALAGSVVVLGSMAGVGVAASRSLPGSPFYDIKLATESAQLWAAQGQLAKGHRHLEFAATRLSEAQRLSPTSSHLPATLNAMDSQTRAGANDLVGAAHSAHSVTPLVELQEFAHQQYAGIRQLLATAPPALRAREIRSATLVEVINTQAARLAAQCVTCSGATTVSGGLGGLLKGSLPTPGRATGPRQQRAGSAASHHRHAAHGGGPGPRSSGRPGPRASLPVRLPTVLPSGLPTLPTTVKSLLPTLPTKLPSRLPTLLPTALPTILPTIKL